MFLEKMKFEVHIRIFSHISNAERFYQSLVNFNSVDSSPVFWYVYKLDAI